MLVYTLAQIGVCTAAIGFWGPVLLVSFRNIQGLGAELAGAAVTAYEYTAKDRRGRQGGLLSSLAIYLLSLGGG